MSKRKLEEDQQGKPFEKKSISDEQLIEAQKRVEQVERERVAAQAAQAAREQAERERVAAQEQAEREQAAAAGAEESGRQMRFPDDFFLRENKDCYKIDSMRPKATEVKIMTRYGEQTIKEKKNIHMQKESRQKILCAIFGDTQKLKRLITTPHCRKLDVLGEEDISGIVLYPLINLLSLKIENGFGSQGKPVKKDNIRPLQDPIYYKYITTNGTGHWEEYIPSRDSKTSDLTGIVPVVIPRGITTAMSSAEIKHHTLLKTHGGPGFYGFLHVKSLIENILGNNPDTLRGKSILCINYRGKHNIQDFQLGFGGTMLENECAIHAAQRELREETMIAINSKYFVSHDISKVIYYPPNSPHLLSINVDDIREEPSCLLINTRTRCNNYSNLSQDIIITTTDISDINNMMKAYGGISTSKTTQKVPTYGERSGAGARGGEVSDMYYQKYLKYKTKYLNLKQELGL